jgi:hypothetical protein
MPQAQEAQERPRDLCRAGCTNAVGARMRMNGTSSVYVQMDLQFGEKFNVQVGARYVDVSTDLRRPRERSRCTIVGHCEQAAIDLGAGRLSDGRDVAD